MSVRYQWRYSRILRTAVLERFIPIYNDTEFPIADEIEDCILPRWVIVV